MNRIRNGFTLIEVLIVVVIIAIVAALILPRMIDQSKKAEVAEALQMFGVMKRALDNTADLNGDYPQLYLWWDPFVPGGLGDWTKIGVRDDIVRSSKKWAYEIVSGPTYYSVYFWNLDRSGYHDTYLFFDRYIPEDSNYWECGGLLSKTGAGDEQPCKLA